MHRQKSCATHAAHTDPAHARRQRSPVSPCFRLLCMVYVSHSVKTLSELPPFSLSHLLILLALQTSTRLCLVLVSRSIKAT